MSRGSSNLPVDEIIDGRYRIIDTLGEGGMGCVYRAEHIGIKREVAIKLLHEELRGTEGVNERLTREAFATGRLDHPNCVGITDSGELEDGTTYLVMELLDGHSLGEELEHRGTIPVEECLQIARQTLLGLAHAHEVGVVHRDLKPDNIFLSRHDGELIVKILDFGIAKLLGDARDAEGGSDITMSGIAIGSPTYMSPEQATGSTISGQTDVYSLSLVMYEMLTGQPPFYEPDDKVLSLQRRLKEKPPLMRTPKGKPVPPDVERLVRDGLAKLPIDRISTAQAYVERIDQILAKIPGARRPAPPTAQPPPDLTAESSKFWHTWLNTPKKRWTAIGTSGGILFLLVLLLSLGGGSAADEDDNTDGMDARLESELSKLNDSIAAGDGSKHLVDLQKLQHLWPKDPRTNRLLGLANAQKRHWPDAFKYLRNAVSLDPVYKSDPVIIKAALRSLASRNRAELGVRFLVEDIGETAVGYLEETASGGGSRQREMASKALAQLQQSK